MFRLYLSKVLFVAFLTTVFLGGIGTGQPFWYWPVLALPAMAIYLFVFDDYLEWYRHKGERWLLTDQRLLHAGSDALEGRADLDLRRTRRIRRWMWWSLVLRLEDGRAITIKFLPDRRAVRDRIVQARDRAQEAIP
ncbi:MAG: hypothetical protein GY717_09690 [Rhodobacteraceae bacterium]|nr:hypothetical protein [Paracoccaceae bacterium]